MRVPGLTQTHWIRVLEGKVQGLFLGLSMTAIHVLISLRYLLVEGTVLSYGILRTYGHFVESVGG